MVAKHDKHDGNGHVKSKTTWITNYAYLQIDNIHQANTAPHIQNTSV